MNTATPHTAVDVSVVVIGRNEGARLQRCLQSIQQAQWGPLLHEVIYIDSHSGDGSMALAQSLGALAYSIGDRRLCAASARNLGCKMAQGQFVLFLDGDTILHPSFIQQAMKQLVAHDVAAVWGHRREIHPRQSIYTRVLDLDWVYPLGETDYFGGDVLVRRTALLQVGGFDEQLVAGEEPELGWRLRHQGWRILHIDAPMTGHDLAIQSGRAYWRRAVRTGLAYAQVADRFARSQDPLWQREVQRNTRHALCLLAWACLLLPSLWVSPALTIVLLAAGLGLWVRSSLRCLWKCPNDGELAALYALHAHIQQIPIFFGQCLWLKLKWNKQTPELMEYHTPPTGR